MTQGPEQRQNPRYSCYAKVTLSDTWLGYLRNISLCGARLSVISPKPFSAGECLQIRMRASTSEAPELSMRGVVVWSESFGPYCDVGVSFGDATPDEAKEISHFADILAERQSADPDAANVEVEILGDTSSSDTALSGERP